MRRLFVVLVLATAGAAGGAGCSGVRNQNRPVQPVSSAEAQRMRAEREEFERIKDPPITADTRFAAGQLAESQGALPNAVDQYRQALKLAPGHLAAMYRLGVVYAQLKQYPEAIEVWHRYIKAAKDTAAGYSNLGFCYELAGRPADAERAYRQGIERNSASAPCRVNYGLMLARHGRTNEAILQLQAVLSPAEVHYNLASVYESQGRAEEAKAEYRKALELDPKLEDATARLDAME